MKIEIVPFEASKTTNIVEKAEVERGSPRGFPAQGQHMRASPLSFESAKLDIIAPQSTTT
jgi:hypothetical protein